MNLQTVVWYFPDNIHSSDARTMFAIILMTISRIHSNYMYVSPAFVWNKIKCVSHAWWLIITMCVISGTVLRVAIITSFRYLKAVVSAVVIHRAVLLFHSNLTHYIDRNTITSPLIMEHIKCSLSPITESLLRSTVLARECFRYRSSQISYATLH